MTGRASPATPEEEVLAALRRVARKLETEPARLRRERLALYRRGRALGLSHRALGRAAGVSNVSVVQELKKAEEASAP